MILPFDELNVIDITKSEDEIVDEILDYLIEAYVKGFRKACDDLGFLYYIYPEEQYRAIFKKIAGKTFEDSVREYASKGNLAGVVMVGETGMVRVYNQAVLDVAARSGGNIKKTWLTMDDDKVRGTHRYLHGISVGVNEDFYTYDGDHAPAPGGFENAENNVNCRCEIQLSQ